MTKNVLKVIKQKKSLFSNLSQSSIQSPISVLNLLLASLMLEYNLKCNCRLHSCRYSAALKQEVITKYYLLLSQKDSLQWCWSNSCLWRIPFADRLVFPPAPQLTGDSSLFGLRYRKQTWTKDWGGFLENTGRLWSLASLLWPTLRRSISRFHSWCTPQSSGTTASEWSDRNEESN